ncbi:HIT family protein [Caldivirga sp.]|uniref:HIT family protein n=1 Tax=Caldivirga sp. TaxID=2080243 RepID=UPI0025BAFA4B|nr:HIT family protein [Caldivirga sp.]
MKIPGVEYRTLCRYCNLNSELLIAEEDDFTIYAYDEPFNNGHIVIVPRRHVSLSELSVNELYRALRLVRKAEAVLRNTYHPHGLNIGLVAYPHVAFHVVPRWGGDVSFIKVFFNAKPIPETPIQYAERLRKAWGS